MKKESEKKMELIAAIIGALGIIVSAFIGVGGEIVANYLAETIDFWTTAAILIGGMSVFATLFILALRFKSAISSNKFKKLKSQILAWFKLD